MGGCGVVMPKYFYGFEKMLGGGLCQNILWGVEIVWGVEKCLGVCQQILCMDLKKKIGGVVIPKYFIDLKKCWGGGLRPYAKTF